MNGDRKVVWILGSGFSCGLGGPMLNQLMDQSRFNRLTALYLGFNGNDNKEWRAHHQKWGELVNAYRAVADDSAKSGSPWRDPEEFVELLQMAAHKVQGEGTIEAEQAQELFRAIEHTAAFNNRWDELARAGEQYLAALTHEFIAFSTGARTERWEPYTHWAKQLRPQDHVVTFNWDLVVERAYKAAHRTSAARTGIDANPWLHKLHGSIDWVTRGGAQSITQVDVVEDAIMGMRAARHSSLALGVPGPGKPLSCNGVFKPIWDAAREALRQADEIIFVGYRFPPSDSFAKRELLRAISENQRPELIIRTVLGPKVGDDVLRLEGMLMWALSDSRDRISNNPKSRIMNEGRQLYYSLISEPMYAEDFMTVYRRDHMLSYVRP